MVISPVEFVCARLNKNLDGLYETPTQKLESELSPFGSQEIGSGSVSFKIIFEALQSELLRLTLHDEFH